MPNKIIIVRHGETDFNIQRIYQGHLDTYLNYTGLKQAETAASNLSEIEIDAIYSSDLKRAFQTAQIIAKKLKLKIVTTRLLRERYFGDFQGLTFNETQKFIPQYSSFNDHNDIISRLYKIESDDEMIKRLQKFLKFLKKKHKGKNILLVSHGGIVKKFLKIFNARINTDSQSEHFSNTAVTVFAKITTGYETQTLTTKSLSG